jgi:hypothetical protein
MRNQFLGGLMVALMFGGAVFATPPRRVVPKQVVAQNNGVAKIEKRFVEYNPYNPLVLGLPVDNLGLGYYYSVGDQAKLKAANARIDELEGRVAELEGALSDLIDKLSGTGGGEVGGDDGKSDGGGDVSDGPDEQLEAKLLAHRTHMKEMFTVKYDCKKCHNQDVKKGGFQIFNGDNVIVWDDELAMRKIKDNMVDGSMPKRPQGQPPATKGDTDYIDEYINMKWKNN